MTRILVPTDFSKEAQNATQYAVDWVKQNGGEIILLHCLDLPIMYEPAPFGDAVNHEQIVFLRKLSEKKFKETIESIEANVKITSTVSFSSFIDAIDDGCDKYGIDLIIMGTKGKKQYTGSFLSTNTAKVVRRSNKPVLVVPEGKAYQGHQNCLILSDFKNNESKEMSDVINFLKPHNVIFNLLHVITPNQFERSAVSLTKMQEFADHHEINVMNSIPYADFSVYEGLKNFQQNYPCDLTILGTTGKNSLERMIWGSESNEVVSYCDFPLLTFKL